MTLTDDIISMKNQGVEDTQIVETLTQQGVSPKEIQDAISRAQIKNAVSGETPEYQPQEPASSEYQPQEYQNTQNEYNQEGYAPQEGYDNYGSESGNSIEVAEQVFDEKSKKLLKQLSELKQFKILSESKIENISERLKKIEDIIDKLQMSILNKIGSYGDDLSSIKKEMGMMQDSFGKVIKKSSRKSKK